jgi:hypothetical protein
MDHKVGEAVVAYRKQVAADFDRDRREEEIKDMVNQFDPIQFAEYLHATLDIDHAADEVMTYIDARSPALAGATQRQMFRAAINKAGTE